MITPTTFVVLFLAVTNLEPFALITDIITDLISIELFNKTPELDTATPSPGVKKVTPGDGGGGSFWALTHPLWNYSSEGSFSGLNSSSST